MKYFLIAIAFCSSGYTALGCVAQWMSAPANGKLYWATIGFRGFAAISLVCCVFALFRPVPAAILSWVAALAYGVMSWHSNAPWVFHEQVWRFLLWTPIFLSLACALPNVHPDAS